MYDIIIGRSEKDREKYGTEGTIFLGKHYVKMGQTTSLSNKVYMDVTRSHVVFVCGKRGSGKCLTGDTLITSENGLEMPIKELEGNKEKVFGLNDEFKIKAFEKTDFFKREVNSILRVKLRSGREIKLTPEHPLLTINGWKEVKDLTIGTRIAISRKVECFGKERMDESSIKILAYLIAEGHTKRLVLFSNSDKEIIEDFRNSLLQLHPSIELTELQKYCFKINSRNIKRKVLDYKINRDNKGRFTKGSRITHEKTEIRQFLEMHELHGLGALEKFIPRSIFKLNKEGLTLFLNRLFSCDGSVYKPIKSRPYWEISYSSSSEKLARQVQSLLLRFGIISKLRKKKVKCDDKIFDSFELVLDGENVIRFIKEIGFFGNKKGKQIIALKEMEEIKRNTNIDTIPKEIWDYYRPKNWADIGRKLGYRIPKALRSSISYSPSRQKLLQIAIADNNERLRLLAESDVFWDEIVSIEKLEGNFIVYDITVPEAHNFIANNIIVHNSYTMGVIAEGIIDLPPEIKNNLAIVMLDTMGIYWTMKYPNDKEADLLKEWGLEGKELDVKIYTPVGYYEKYKEEGIATDEPFSIKPSELDPSDWCMTFNIDITSAEGVLIERMINDLKEKEEDYDIDDIINTIKKDNRSKQEVRDAVENRFIDSTKWGIFSKEGTPLKDLVKGGQVTVLDVGCYATIPGTQGLRALVIGLVAEKLFVQRMISRKNEELQSIKETTHFMGEKAEIRQKEPLVWLVIDECLPYSSKVETDKGIKDIGDVVKYFNKGKKIDVIGYDSHTKKYGFYPVTKCYKRPKRFLMAFIIETGQSIICTPDHRIFSSKGFCEAQKSPNIAIPLLKPYKKNKRLIEARLLGSILGDGWLSTNGELIGFSGKGNNKDLEKIKEDLAELGFKSSSVHTKKTRSKIESVTGEVVNVNGTSSSVTSSTKAWRYFKKLGAPVGTKVLVEYKIPSWIFKGSKEVKCEFLAGLMGADGYIISRNVNIPSDFNPIRLSFNKIYSLENNAFDFARALKKIFQDVGVKVSNTYKRLGNIRKDGNKTFKIQITLAKSISNTIKYLGNIGYRYCEKKEVEGQKWLAYLKYRKNIIEERNKLRLKAIKLHKEKGLGKVRIGKMLGVPDYIIREWIYYKNKAGVPKNFPSFEEWTSKRVFNNNLFLKIVDKREIGQEIVYDLSVDKVHNFVADGFLVHNCHEFLPDKGETVASHPLQIILREGRQPGISLVLASQQPGRIHTDVMTQSDIVIAHRITAKVDIDALGALMQSYMREGLDKQLNVLPRLTGSAIIFDDTNERMYSMRVRPRFTWHGGEAPTAIHKVKKVFDF